MYTYTPHKPVPVKYEKQNEQSNKLYLFVGKMPGEGRTSITADLSGT